MTIKEKMDSLMKTGEFDFIKDIPKEQFWKLVFFITYVYGLADKESEDKE